MTVPEVTVHNLQRKISVNVAQLEKFTGNAVQHSLQLQKGKQTDLRKAGEVSVWLISDRRMALLHRKFLGQSGPTDVLTFQHGEIFISVETAQRLPSSVGVGRTRSHAGRGMSKPITAKRYRGTASPLCLMAMSHGTGDSGQRNYLAANPRPNPICI